MSQSDCGIPVRTDCCKRPIYGDAFNWRVSVRGRAGPGLLSPRASLPKGETLAFGATQTSQDRFLITLWQTPGKQHTAAAG